MHLTSSCQSQLSRKMSQQCVWPSIVVWYNCTRQAQPKWLSKKKWDLALAANGCITSSWFREILHRKASTSGCRLVTEITWYTDDKVWAVPELHWGRDNKKPAWKAYLHHRHSKDTEMKIRDLLTGLQLSTLHSFLGASSDGLVTGALTRGCPEGKCTFSQGASDVCEKLPPAIAHSSATFFL